MSKPGNVIVIGAGILGTACAYEMAKAGYAVTVLEKGGIASSASGANMGQISVLDRPEAWHQPLVSRSFEIYQEFMKTDPQIAFRLSGGTYLIEREEEFATSEAAAEEFRKAGHQAEVIRGDRLKEHLPLASDHILGAMITPEEGLLNPLKTVLMYYDKARKLGVRFHEYEAVTGFEKTGNRVLAVVTDKETYPCDAVLLAAGSWTAKLGELLDTRINLGYVRGTAFLTRPMPRYFSGQLNGTTFLPGNNVTVGPDEDGHEIIVGVSQNENGNITIAQANIYTDVDSADVSLTSVGKVAKQLLLRFPGMKDMEVLRIWSAVTPLSEDGAPYYGFLSKAENVLCCAGFRGAFTTAPAVAEMAARDISGETDSVDPVFSPER